MKKDNTITLRSILWGAFFSGLFALISVYCSNAFELYLSASQIPVLPFLLLFLTVVLINPVCRLVRFIRPFTSAEILVIFVMGFVSGGVSTFGLSAQVVPLMSNLYNGQWNTPQSEWNRYVEPFMAEKFFVAEDGVQKAACEYRTAVDELNRQRRIYDAAFGLSRGEEQLRQAERVLQAQRSQAAGNDKHMAAVVQAESDVKNARQYVSDAEALWKQLQIENVSLREGTVQSVLTSAGEAIRVQETVVKRSRDDAMLLETKAFTVVEQWRRGLPEGQRALPGLLPAPQDDFTSYAARFRRMREGRRALAALTQARAATAADVMKSRLRDAVAILSPVADTTRLVEQIKAVETTVADLRNEKMTLEAESKKQSEAGRFASSENRVKIRTNIAELTRRLVKIEEERRKAELAREKVLREIDLRGIVTGVIEKLKAVEARADGQMTGDALMAIHTEIDATVKVFPSFDASLSRYVLSDIPWRSWMPGLLRWGALIGLTYMVLMTFNVLIFRQWAHNEKLIFPLVQIPEALAGAGEEESGRLPSIFYSGLFWGGVVLSVSVMGWNLLCKTNAVEGLLPIPLDGNWDEYIKDSPLLKALVGEANSHIFFTMIGLSFLIPQKISFSLWFFTGLYYIQLITLCTMGYGISKESFPADWGSKMNFRFAEGSGALMVFSMAVLYKCRKYILACLRPGSMDGLEDDEQRELRISSLLFLTGSMGIVGILWLGMGANPWYSIFLYIVILLLTIGLIRAVTEGGILAFQAWCGPFHFIRTFVGMNKAWTAPSVLLPLIPYYMVFFFDLKTFIAPAMANSLKIRDDLRMQRGRFHLALGIGLVVAVIVAILTEIMMGYYRGADKMSTWFHRGFPTSMFTMMSEISKNPPDVDPTISAWCIGGAVLMAALIYFRQFLFWLPHPLGLIMLVNPIMHTYWFSIIIGWLLKSLVTKYGNRESYSKARDFFIGLIVGEILIVALAAMISVIMGQAIQIHLNRN